MVKEIKFKDDELTKIEVEIKLIVDKMGYKLHTMTGIDIVTAAKLIGEIGRYRKIPNPCKARKICRSCTNYIQFRSKGQTT